MKIKILHQGHSAHHVETAAGTTITKLLDREDMSAEDYALSVNDLDCSTSAVIADDNVITLVPKIELHRQWFVDPIAGVSLIHSRGMSVDTLVATFIGKPMAATAQHHVLTEPRNRSIPVKTALTAKNGSVAG